MAKISPFIASYYNPKSVSLSSVVTPPYDVISKVDEECLRNKSQYNYTHVILPKKDEQGYKHSAHLLESWRNAGILIDEKTPHYYVYQQTFFVGNVEHHRKALLCGVSLCDFSERVILPHEKTHTAPKQDRLNILRETKSNLSSIFGMVSDKQGLMEEVFENCVYKDPLLFAKTSDRVSHTIWRVLPSMVSSFETYMEDKPIYIIDGHHRYESSLAYAKEVGAFKQEAHPASKMFFGIVNAYDPALLVYPTHRLISGVPWLSKESVERGFELVPCTEDELSRFVCEPQNEPSLALQLNGELYFALGKHWENAASKLDPALYRLSVIWSDTVLMKEMLEIEDEQRESRVIYERSVTKLLSENKKEDLTIFLPPISREAILKVANAGQFFPQKSTYFYPKLAAGLVWRNLVS